MALRKKLNLRVGRIKLFYAKGINLVHFFDYLVL